MMRLPFLFLITSLLTGCFNSIKMPLGIEPVYQFNIEKYQGKWYEIARLPHFFEDGLSNITAEYRRNDDGGLDVINRGYSEEDGEWEQAEGVAYFAAIQNDGFLKVSFFRPFYASYVIFELDKNYQYAFVTSSDRDYLWLLARGPKVSKDLMDYFLQRSKELGFDTSKLIYVKHSQKLPPAAQ